MKSQKRATKGKLNSCEAFKAEVKRWAGKINVTPQQIRIQTMKKK